MAVSSGNLGREILWDFPIYCMSTCICMLHEICLSSFSKDVLMFLLFSLFLLADWDRTSLGKSIRFFRTSFLQPLLKSCKVFGVLFSCSFQGFFRNLDFANQKIWDGKVWKLFLKFCQFYLFVEILNSISARSLWSKLSEVFKGINIFFLFFFFGLFSSNTMEVL